MTPQEVLLKAADLIEAGGLSHGAYARDVLGESVYFRDSAARAFCVIGAVRRVTDDADSLCLVRREAYSALYPLIGENVVDFSDGHTQAEVVAALRAAAGAPEAQKEGK